MQTSFDFYEDPGHGWVKVSKALLTELGIADKVSAYSYKRGEFAYLEEDCDGTLFVDAIGAKGVIPKFREHTADRYSKIRSYEPYKPFEVKAYIG